jgi:hypothetical protein
MKQASRTTRMTTRTRMVALLLLAIEITTRIMPATTISAFGLATTTRTSPTRSNNEHSRVFLHDRLQVTVITQRSRKNLSSTTTRTSKLHASNNKEASPPEDNNNDLILDEEASNQNIDQDLDAFLDDDDISMLHNIVYFPTDTANDAQQSQRQPTDTTTVLSLQDSTISYFYLQNELGLSEEAMFKITMEAGSALGMTANTVRGKVDVLRKTMDLSDEDLRSILTTQPTLLHLSATKNLAPTILFLVRQLDLGKEDLRTLVVAYPCILAYSIDNLHYKIRFFLDHMQYSVKQCRNLLLSEPKLLAASVDGGLMPRLRFLKGEMEFPLPDIQTLCQKNPTILLKSLDDNLRPKLIFFLIMTLHMSPKEVLKMLLSYPHFLEYHLDDHIRPMVRYLLVELDFSAHEIARMLLKCPRLVTHSLYKIKHVVGYLRYELGLQATDVRRVFYQAPTLVGLTTETLQKKVAFLEACTSAAQIRKVIVGMPTLLNLSVENNLRPKVEYLREQLGGHDELKQAIDRLPTLLGYSFEKRIQPRLQAILQAGVDGSSLTVGIPMKQDKFEKWLQAKEAKTKKIRGEAEAAARPPLLLLPSGKLLLLSTTSDKDKSEEQQQTSSSTAAHQAKGGRIVHWTRERRQN